MIRNLMASTALLALVTAGTFSLAQAQTEPAQTDQPAAMEQPTDAAQPAMTEEPAAETDTDSAAAPAPATTDTATETTTTATETTTVAGSEATLTPEEPTIASAFMGRTVYSSQDPESDNIGEVNDLIIGNDGMITHAVVGVGGFLGIGEKDVAVPFDELQVQEDENGEIRLIYAATKEQLEAAEAFDRTAYDPRERAAEEQQAEADAGLATGGGVAPAPGALPGAATDTAMTPAPAATETETTETETAVTTVPATEPAETDAATTAEPATTDTATVTTEPAITTETTTAESTTTETTTAETTTAATDTTAMSGEGGFVSFSSDQMRASSLMGQEIYGADNESIGEVSDLVLQEDGSTRAAIVDVGGFLGVGEKSVAIPFDQLTMAPSEGGTEPRVTVAMTKEQLEQAPAFERPAMDAQQTAATDPAAQPAAGTDTAMTDPNAPAGTATTDPNMAAEQNAAAQFEPVTQDLTADNLIGSAVYGSNEENLGEVNDVVFDPNGGIQAVVVDVGGFLGIGEKPVAVQFDSLNVQKNGNDDFRLMVNATQEQLEAAPTYDEDAAAAGETQPAVQ
jgi:sporulation protein YlmC with PRC-barrel domain